MRWWRVALAAVGLLCIVAVIAVLNQDRILEHMIVRELTRPDAEMLSDGRIHVITVGTGTPRVVEHRVGACVAVIANGEFLMFDTGPGSIRRADLSDLPVSALSTVFITHLHSDHVAGLGQTINHTWVWGRKEPLDVYGPQGIEQVVEGFRLAYARDVELRHEHVGEEASPLAGSQANAHIIEVPGDDAVLVFDRNGVRVYAFAVDHGVVKPAFGFRVEAGGRSIVISGDLRRDERLVKHAADADILIHEAQRFEMTRRVSAVYERLGYPDRAQQVRATENYHSHPFDAADIAAQAGVKHLIFTHVIPPPINPLVGHWILADVDKHYRGPVTIADDGQRFVLEPVS